MVRCAPVRRSLRALALVACVLLGTAAGAATAPASDAPVITVSDSLRGRSGRLRFRVIRPDAAPVEELDVLARAFGEEIFSLPGIFGAVDSASADTFHFASLVPFAEKQDGRVGVYRVGRWPAEVRRARGEAYRLPTGFIEVAAEQKDIHVSTHFTLGQFLTKDQREVWPKILLLDERLVDKLELLISELRLAGVKADGLGVLSGFRSPQYNARGKNAGRATDSRHTYGDAADVYVDVNGDGRMDDLNKDGRVDMRDAVWLSKLVEKVERKYPELVGGLGVYRATGSHGPFLHVDARGERARWGFPK
jgi:uncharacterized protein YcbK (DUF882 family)